MFPLWIKKKNCAIWMALQFVYTTHTITLSIDAVCRYYSNLSEPDSTETHNLWWIEFCRALKTPKSRRVKLGFYTESRQFTVSQDEKKAQWWLTGKCVRQCSHTRTDTVLKGYVMRRAKIAAQVWDRSAIKVLNKVAKVFGITKKYEVEFKIEQTLQQRVC